MPNAAAYDPFAFLHEQTKAFFGTGVKMWLPATRPAGTSAVTYTVGVECVVGPITAKAAQVAGLVSMPADGLTIQATRADFPFEPRQDDLCKLGVTATGARKYRILAATGAEGLHSHYRILAQREQ